MNVFKAKKRNFAFCAVLLLVSSMAAAATTNFSPRKNVATAIKPPLSAFTVGEHFIFDVFWMGIPVGYGSLEVKEKTVVAGRPAFRIEAVAETNEFLSKIYPVRDVVQTVIDAENFRSLEFRKTVSEGRYRADERVVYDYGQKKIFYESLKNGTKKEYPLDADVQDFLSAFYWFRLQPVKVGQNVHTLVNDEEENWDLEIRCLKTEVKELRGGAVIDTFVVEPKTRLRGVLYARGRAWVHFSAGPERAPIHFTLSTPFGPIVGVLRNVTPGAK